MFANLVPAPYFVRAAELVLNLADVRSVRFEWSEGGLRRAHVVYRSGMSDEYAGAVADALDRTFRDVRSFDAAALKGALAVANPLVAVPPTWNEPPACAEDCRCRANPTISATP